MPDSFDVKSNPDCRIVAAHDDELYGLVGIRIELFMRHFGGKIDKIARADFRRIFEMLTPPDPAPALADIHRDFMRVVVVRASSSIRLQCHHPHPDLRATGPCKIKRGGSALA